MAMIAVRYQLLTTYMLLYGLLVFGDIQKACDNVCHCYWISTHYAVHCVDEGITQFPGSLLVPYNTTMLDISHNSINSLRFHPSSDNGHTAVYSELKRLDATYCNISVIEKDSLSFAPNIESLELSHNGISDISGVFTNSKALISLSLSHNRIDELAPNGFEGLHLEQLDLQNNLIYRIPKGSFSNSAINTLSLDWCPVQYIHKDTFQPLVTSLKHLHWSHNLEDINLIKDLFHGLNLDYLKLTHNKLTNMKFITDDFSVNVLDISYNPVVTVDLWSFSNVVTVILSHCNLTTITCVTNKPTSTPLLEELDISFNNITTLTPGLFNSYFKLKILNLAYNKIAAFEVSTWDRVLNSVDLTGLPLSCDCRLNWIQEQVDKYGLIVKGSKCLETSSKSNIVSCIPPQNMSLSLHAVTVNGNTYFNLVCSSCAVPAPFFTWRCVLNDGYGYFIQNSNITTMDNNSVAVLRLETQSKCKQIICQAENIKGSKSLTFPVYNNYDNAMSDALPTSRNSSSWRGRKAHKELVVILLIVLISVVSCCAVLVAMFVYKQKTLSKCCKCIASKWYQPMDTEDRSHIRLIVVNENA